MDKQPFIDRILETENLTDNLEDKDANWLLDWGIGQLDGVLQGIEDEETAGDRVNALMGVMRKVNRIAGSYQSESSEDLAQDLVDWEARWHKAFGGEEQEKSAEEMKEPAEGIAKMTVREVLETLTKPLAAQKDQAETPPEEQPLDAAPDESSGGPDTPEPDKQ